MSSPWVGAALGLIVLGATFAMLAPPTESRSYGWASGVFGAGDKGGAK